MSDPTQPNSAPLAPAAPAAQTPAVQGSVPAALPPAPIDPKPTAHVGEVIPYFGDESNGTDEHPAIVTRANADGTFNATVFFDGSGPAPRKGLTLEDDGLHQAPPALLASE